MHCWSLCSRIHSLKNLLMHFQLLGCLWWDVVLRHLDLDGLNIHLMFQEGRFEVFWGFQQLVINDGRILRKALLLFSLKGIMISVFVVLVLQTYASFPLRVVVVAALGSAFIRHGLKAVFCSYRQHSFSLSLSLSHSHICVNDKWKLFGRYAAYLVVQ